ncbi:MAG: ATP-binding cassette domain-containing protein [Candidatus Aminicenantes bacterium]|nr:ATP-binding cassette domain-containing protein [Candidatus Aminicenantes bacterium]MDH5715590.1 ATP-binding cassette domain-containing protein [Candidatus Aminicenantes bacterium]
MITIERLQKTYNKFTLSINFIHFEETRTTVIIGPSGCGKSTLLRLIAYLIKPDAGKILIDGIELDAASSRQAKKRMGYVIQEGGLFPHMTAEENVVLVARRMGWDAQKMAHRLHELCEITSISPDLLHRFPLELSGGQRQRISLMRALMLDPPILLMDEPLGALDPIVRVKLQSDLKKIFQRLKKTVLFVTHDVSEAAYFGDEIVLISNGSVVQKGTISDLLKTPKNAFVTSFIRAQRPPDELFRNL